jgi:hypothetical protein
MHLLFAPECAPFAIAAIMLAGLTVIEILAMLLGFSLSELIGKAAPDGHDGVAGLLSWINVGGVPILILIMLILGLFAISGFAIQTVADIIWAPLPALIAAVPAAIITAPLTRASSRIVARIVPRDETYAVEADALIGRMAEVTIGPLDQGLPGRVRAKDAHGNWHMLRAIAGKDEGPLAVGATVLLVDHKTGIFVAVHAQDDLVDPGTSSFREQP